MNNLLLGPRESERNDDNFGCHRPSAPDQRKLPAAVGTG